MKNIFFLVLLAALVTNNFAQETPRAKGAIFGKVFDAAQRTPIEFANVLVFSAKDSALVTGIATNAKGEFRLEPLAPGVYYLDVQFIGFKKKRVSNLVIEAARATVEVGGILLQQTTLAGEGVEVEAEALAISYQLDKKVINVGRQAAATSGTVVDVLENVPSVTVDIEGNVSLRGSSNFTVLIDGRPSILEPSDALQQIPASTVENIEIVTNPSAKHDPEGASGIINIVLKKERRSGRSGIVNLNLGAGEKYGGDFLYDYKSGVYQATLGADYNRRLFTGTEQEENQTTRAGLISTINSDGDSRRQDKNLGVRGELRWEPTRKDEFNLGGRLGERNSVRGSTLRYFESISTASTTSEYASTSDRFRARDFFATNAGYRHRFAPKGHELAAELFYSRREGDEANTFALRTLGANMISGQRNTEVGPSRELRAKVDYTLALGERSKLEAGYQSEWERSEDRTGLAEYDSATGAYLTRAQFSNVTQYDENAHALYALYATTWRGTSYQLGLRGELTDRAIYSASAAQRFVIDQWDYFPSVHVSRQIGGQHQAMASYTRRIERPNGGELEPFLTWVDAYNVRVGNPALQAEYIDSYEIGYQMNFAQSQWSLEAYGRKTHNKIEDVRSVYADNVTLQSAANIGSDYTLGSELLWTRDFTKKWTVNLTGNLYQYRINGVLFNEAFKRESFNWNLRGSNSIKWKSGTQLQLDGIYNSPSVATQGRREGFFTANIALKQEFFDRMIAATLQVRDVFRSAKEENISEGENFYNYRSSRREAPVVLLNLKYNFNHYKTERNGRREEREDEEF